MRGRSRHSRALAIGLAAVIFGVGVAACGSSSTSSTHGSSNGTAGGQKSTLKVAVFVPFTGPLAVAGPIVESGCLAAVSGINTAGGVMGHDFACHPIDSKGDPADAVPAATSLLASTSNLVGMLGPSVEAPSVSGIIGAAHIPMVSPDGISLYNHNTNPYFFRLIPPDSIQAATDAIGAKDLGYKRVAVVFTTDPGALTLRSEVPTYLKRLGLTVVSDQTLTPAQTDYRTEASALLAAHPQAVITETDAPTAGTFWSEVQSMNGGKVPPLLGDQASEITDYTSAMTKALGASNFHITNMALVVPSSGPAVTTYSHLLAAVKGVKDPTQFLGGPGNTSAFDGATIYALAMLEAHSTSPPKWVPYIRKVTNTTGSNVVIVHTFAQGKQALAQGKQIRYIGPSGVINLDKYGNQLGGGWRYYRYVPTTKQEVPAGPIIPTDQIEQLVGG